MCTHLQCFDASIYLQMNERLVTACLGPYHINNTCDMYRKARWVCPVCDKPAPVESLVVDG